MTVTIQSDCCVFPIICLIANQVQFIHSLVFKLWCHLLCIVCLQYQGVGMQKLHCRPYETRLVPATRAGKAAHPMHWTSPFLPIGVEECKEAPVALFDIKYGKDLPIDLRECSSWASYWYSDTPSCVNIIQFHIGIKVFVNTGLCLHLVYHICTEAKKDWSWFFPVCWLWPLDA